MKPACPVTTRFEKKGTLVNPPCTNEVTQKTSEHQQSEVRWAASLSSPPHSRGDIKKATRRSPCNGGHAATLRRLRSALLPAMTQYPDLRVCQESALLPVKTQCQFNPAPGQRAEHECCPDGYANQYQRRDQFFHATQLYTFFVWYRELCVYRRSARV